MPSNIELNKRREASVARAIAYASTFVTAKAENAELWDVEGNRYIDFYGGIGCQNVGHRHPEVVAAIERQLKTLTHTCFQVSPYESYIKLAESSRRPDTKTARRSYRSRWRSKAA